MKRVFLFVPALLVCLGACAALKTPAESVDERTYAVPHPLVIEAAAAAYADAGLDLENGFWKDDSTYVLTGFSKSAMLRDRGEAIRVAEFNVFITRRGDYETFVAVETSQADLPAAASSAADARDEPRRFFDRLDNRLR